MTGYSEVTRSISEQGAIFRITVDNISNEVGLRQERFVSVFCFPKHTRVSAQLRVWLIVLSPFCFFPFSPFTRPARPIHFIVSVLPTRHLFGPC